MTLIRFLGGVAALALVFGTSVRADSVQTGAEVGWVIALGRLPKPSETHANSTMTSDFVPQLKKQLASDPALAAAVAQKAFVDAFGHTPATADLVSGGALTYAEWMQRHVSTLSEHADQYEAVIRAAYPVVIHRDAYPEEIAYWKKHGVIPYYLLLAGIDNWARRNQPGLMVTAGKPTVSINCQYLDAARVAPSSVADVRGVLGLQALPEKSDGSTHGRVLASGADAFESDGGIYFVSAGRSSR